MDKSYIVADGWISCWNCKNRIKIHGTHYKRAVSHLYTLTPEVLNQIAANLNLGCREILFEIKFLRKKDFMKNIEVWVINTRYNITVFGIECIDLRVPPNFQEITKGVSSQKKGWEYLALLRIAPQIYCQFKIWSLVWFASNRNST